jgi:hypothetical protein
MEATVSQSATSVVEMPRNNSPLPTDSMVTVRLSDAQIHPVSDDAVRDSRRSRRSSSVNSHASSISARSSTRSSTPSNTTVDWEELEKTEEQEPRDRATDEVCFEKSPQATRQALMQIVHRSPPGSLGARECCIGGKPQIWPRFYYPDSQRHSPTFHPTSEEACQWSPAAEPTVFAPPCPTDDRT